MSTSKTRRRLALKQFQSMTEGPMVVLGFVWLILLVIELVYKTGPVVEVVGIVIWVIFIIDFLIKVVLTPAKVSFLKSNVITIVSLIVPAFRMLRVIRLFRFLRLSRSLRLVKIIGGLSRGMRALSRTMQRRAFGYVLLLTGIVVAAGSAGMYAFERDMPNGLDTYSKALWWTMMIMTTLGSEYWPQTPEGRTLCIVLALYAFAVFGYITATLASFFIGRDADDQNGGIAGREQIAALKSEIESLKKMVASWRPPQGNGNSG